MSGRNEPVQGCGDCPLLSSVNEEFNCALNDQVEVALNGSGEPTLAGPVGCPLWEGPVTVTLKALENRSP